MMIEKLLRRFVSEETEFVLKAMEQVGGDPDAPYQVQLKYTSMFNAAVEAAPRKVDRAVLSAVSQRLKKERKRREAAAMAQTIAAKILMGDDFRDPEPAKTSGPFTSAAQQVQIQQLQAQAQYSQLMQQAHAMQAGQAALAGTVLGGLAP